MTRLLPLLLFALTVLALVFPMSAQDDVTAPFYLVADGGLYTGTLDDGITTLGACTPPDDQVVMPDLALSPDLTQLAYVALIPEEVGQLDQTAVYLCDLDAATLTEIAPLDRLERAGLTFAPDNGGVAWTEKSAADGTKRIAVYDLASGDTTDIELEAVPRDLISFSRAQWSDGGITLVESRYDNFDSSTRQIVFAYAPDGEQVVAQEILRSQTDGNYSVFWLADGGLAVMLESGRLFVTGGDIDGREEVEGVLALQPTDETVMLTLTVRRDMRRGTVAEWAVVNDGTTIFLDDYVGAPRGIDFAPDGTQLAYVVESQVRVLDGFRTTSLNLPDGVDGSEGALVWGAVSGWTVLTE